MSAPVTTGYEALAEESAHGVDDACDQFEIGWRAGQRPAIEDFLRRLDGDDRQVLLRELILLEVAFRRRAGETPEAGEYAERFPSLDSHWLDRVLTPPTLPDLGSPTYTDLPAAVPQGIHGFEVLGELGRGGMAIVYKARDVHLNRIVALKTIAGGALAAPKDRERFRREAEAIAHLDHPNIVPVYEVGEAAGVPYFSMKFFAGGSLAKHRPTDPQAIAGVVEATARAVHHAHQRGVLHRDLKPSNVLLDEKGQPHVADFGLAKRFDPEATPRDASTIAGTPAYMAPEQLAGRSELTTATDVYGLGVILYELLSGAPPFDGDSPMAILKQLTESMPPRPSIRNPNVPRDLETIAAKCMEKDPRRRYESAQALADDLERWQLGLPIVARPVPVWETAWRGIRRHPVIVGLALLAAAAFFLFVGTLIVSHRRISEALAEECQARGDLSAALRREQQLLYFERVSSAGRLWFSNQTVRAEQLLDQCPEHLRQWEWQYLDRVRRHDCTKLMAHTAEVSAVAVSHDGRRFATADDDGVVRLWDAANHALVRSWTTKQAAHRLAFSPDAASLAVSRTESVLILSIAGDTKRELKGNRWIAFHPDGERLATANESKIIICNWRSGEILHEFFGHDRAVWIGAMSPDGQRLATSGADSTVRQWAVDTGKLLGAPKQFPQAINALHYLSDGRLLVSQRSESVIVDSAFDKELARAPLGCHGADRLAVSRDDRYLAGPARDGTIKVWNLKTLEEEYAFRGHPPYISNLAFSRDSSSLISVGNDSVVRIWRLTSPIEARLLTRDRASGRTSFSSNGSRLAIALGGAGSHFGEKDRVRILDVQSGRELLRLSALGNPCFAPDDRWLATNRADGSISLWDPATGREIRHLSAAGHRSMRIAVSSDGQRLASGTSKGKVLIWNLSTDDPPRELSGHTDLITSLGFSFDGRTLVSCDRHGKIIVWDDQGRRINDWSNGEALQFTALSPDGTRLAIAGASSTIFIFDVPSGQLAHKLHGHIDWVAGLAFSPDGSRLVSGSADETVRLWDIDSEVELLSLAGVSGIVTNVAFDPSGRWIAASENGVRVWEID